MGIDLEKLKKLKSYDGEDKVISAKELKVILGNPPSREVSSGLWELDSMIDGFVGGELTTISGATGNGKTLFAETLTKNFEEQKHHCVWFTYEVRPVHFLTHFGLELPSFYMPAKLKTNSMDWIEERILEAKVKYDVKVFFIDHLHFLVDMASRNNMSLEIGAVMRKLKNICVDNNLKGFLIAHMQKSRYIDKKDPEPGLEDIRDSSFIAQESDNVFIIWRRKNKDNGAYLKVDKNRRLGVMGRKIPLIKVNNFLEVDIGQDKKA